MKSYIIGVFVAAMVLVLPSVSHAYFTTAQTAVDLGNGYALFTVTYKFGFLNRDVYIPILASRNKDFADTDTNAGYSILFDDKTEAQAFSTIINTQNAKAQLNYSILPGKSKAIILSKAEIKDGRYFLPKGKSEEFTLIAIVDTSNSTIRKNISLLMTALPFKMIDNKESVDARLNPSELQYYKTPKVSLK